MSKGQSVALREAWCEMVFRDADFYPHAYVVVFDKHRAELRVCESEERSRNSTQRVRHASRSEPCEKP
jgi:hypothetical protein